MNKVFFKGVRKGYNIIQVDQTLVTNEAGQNKLHESFKSGWCITEDEWQHTEFEQASMACECCLVLVIRVNSDLPIS
jgi:hypothetical protein